MNTAPATVATARSSTGKVVLECAPEVQELFHFMTLFGLPPDPVHFGRITESEGLATKHLQQFIKTTGLKEEEIVLLMSIAPRTMERRLEAGRINAEEADKLFQVARAFDLMTEILGSSRRALVWFKTPQPALDDHTPLEKCRTENGRNMVNTEVQRINWGVY